MPKLLIAAGGTGGHMFPAQALAETLKARGWDIAMMTDARGKKHAGNIPADPILEVQAASISPRKPIAALRGTMKLAAGVRQARAFINAWQPDIVVGFGGYPAFPAMRTAQGANIPTIIHEQNAVLGRVNRTFAARALHVASGFEVLEKCPARANHICIGNPMRAQIIKAVPTEYTAPTDVINLLIVGGSLGAKIVSENVPEAVSLLPQEMRVRLRVVQQTRAEYRDAAKQVYTKAGVQAVCEPFFENIETHLAAAHFVIGRAGASSVSEVAVMGKPSLLVPLRIAMDDHQTVNARSLARLGAAEILTESEFTPQSVATILRTKLNDSHWLETAAATARTAGRPNAADDLAALVINAVK